MLLKVIFKRNYGTHITNLNLLEVLSSLDPVTSLCMTGPFTDATTRKPHGTVESGKHMGIRVQQL